VGGNAAIVSSWVFYVDALFNIRPSGPGNWGIALVGLWIPAGINLAGIRQTAWLQNLTVVLKYLPLLFVGVVGWFFVTKANFGAFNASRTAPGPGSWSPRWPRPPASGRSSAGRWSPPRCRGRRPATACSPALRLDRPPGSAWSGIVVAAVLPSLLMLWRYTASSGLTVFTYLVDLTVVTVAIPYLFSACAQLTYLVSRRRRVQGWLLARLRHHRRPSHPSCHAPAAAGPLLPGRLDGTEGRGRLPVRRGHRADGGDRPPRRAPELLRGTAGTTICP
jgi:hypothetical protein